MIESLPLILFGIVFLLILLGYPVAFTLGGASVLFGLAFLDNTLVFKLLPYRIFGIMNNQVMLAVPLFVYMGVMLEKSGLAERMLETMALLFGRFRGGLAISVLIVGALLAASTGIVGATVITMGLISLPVMLKRGYKTELATGIIASSGTLGQIIPPSIVLVLLATQLNVSVGDLFKAAVIPGLLLVGAYLLYLIGVAIFKPQNAPSMPKEEVAAFWGQSFKKRLEQSLLAFMLPMSLIVAVLGSIFAGLASPTEAAAIGALGATILMLVNRIRQGGFKKAIFSQVMQETTKITSMVFMILIGATAFSLVFKWLGGDRYLTEIITDSALSPMAFLWLVMAVVFVAGFFIDFIEIIFIVVPIIVPLFRNLGLHTELSMDFNSAMVWVGILLAMNLQTSFLTPPFGFSLFYLKGVAPPNVSTPQIYRGILPFIAIQILFLGILIAFPSLITLLL
ncbi:MAG: TRAP transporter large permease subunit [Bacteroidota bacterium]